MLLSLQYFTVSAFFKEMIGRIILPLTGGMPHSPESDVPLDMFKIKVSTLSESVCAVAILVVSFPATSSKNLYRTSLPHSSTLSPCFLASSFTSFLKTLTGTFFSLQKSITNFSSRSASCPLNIWFTCATVIFKYLSF